MTDVAKAPKKVANTKNVQKPAAHSPFSKMILAAVRALKDKKGSSRRKRSMSELKWTGSKRGQHTLGNFDFLISYFERSHSNAFHPENNPEILTVEGQDDYNITAVSRKNLGIVNFGTAENKLMESEIRERLARGDMFDFSSLDHQYYYELWGKTSLRKALAGFFNKYFNVAQPIQPDDLVVMTGSGTCLDSLSFALFDPGDVMLTPTPAYGRIYTDVNDRSLAQPMPLELSSEIDEEGNSFVLTPELLEERILELKKQRMQVKGFLLINPHNPLGDIYPSSLVLSLLKICAKYEMQVILDEVYALSFFEADSEVQSVLSLHDVPDPERTHFVWSMSKDFGLAGLRLGVIHTRSRALVKVLRDVAIYSSTPSIVQDAVEKLLRDEKWLEEVYFPLNRRRLREVYQMTRTRLTSLGITVREAKAGLFVWLNMSRFMKGKSHQHAMDLFDYLFEGGVYIVPGPELFCSEPGWFRIVFSVTEKELETGLNRLEVLLKKRIKEIK